MRITAELPIQVSRVCRARQVQQRLRVTAVQHKGDKDGRPLMELTLEGQLGSRGTRLSVSLEGFGGGAELSSRKTENVGRDRRTATIKAPAGWDAARVAAPAADVVERRKQPAVTAWWEEQPGGAAALLFEAKPSELSITATGGGGAGWPAALAPQALEQARRQLWACLGERAVRSWVAPRTECLLIFTAWLRAGCCRQWLPVDLKCD